MYCIKCGVELADSEKVCPLCGTRVFHPDLPCGQADCFFLHPLGQFIELLACAACKQDIYHKPAQRHHDQPDAQAHEQAHGPARQTLRPLFRPFCLFQSCFLDTFK